MKNSFRTRYRRRKHVSKKACRILLVLAVAALICILAFTLKGSFYALLVLSAAIIHEAGHILTAKLFGVKRVKSAAGLFSMSLKYDFSKSPYYVESAVGFAGPLFNIAACCICAAFGGCRSLTGVFFVFSNAALALFNLMPISPLDGFGIVGAVFSEIAPPDTVIRVSRVISSLFSFAFFVLTVYIQLKIGANLSLMLLSAFLLLNCFREKY